MTSKAIWRDRAKAWQAMCKSWMWFENNASNKYLQSRRWSAAWKRAARKFRNKWQSDIRWVYAEKNTNNQLRVSNSRLKTECEDARNVARRLLRERDEAALLLTDCQDRVDRYFAKITSLKSQVSKVEAERDEARAERDEKEMVNDILETDFVLMNEHIHHLESDRDALAKQCDELRGALEQVEWGLSEDGHIIFNKCPWCGERANVQGTHAPDCPRQKALGKA